MTYVLNGGRSILRHRGCGPEGGHGVPSGQMVSVPRIERGTAYRGMLRCSTPCFLMTNFHLHFEPICAIVYFFLRRVRTVPMPST